MFWHLLPAPSDWMSIVQVACHVCRLPPLSTEDRLDKKLYLDDKFGNGIAARGKRS